jgi:hypothetical protein
MVRWMLSGAVVVWLWEVVLICVRDNSWVVGWLRPTHPVSGGLRFRAVPRWVRAVFVVKQAVKSTRLLRPSSAPTTGAIAAALGDNLDGEGPHRRGAGWQCYAPAADCGCPDRSLTARVLSMFGWTAEVLGFPLGLDLALVELNHSHRFCDTSQINKLKFHN